MLWSANVRAAAGIVWGNCAIVDLCVCDVNMCIYVLCVLWEAGHLCRSCSGDAGLAYPFRLANTLSALLKHKALVSLGCTCATIHPVHTEAWGTRAGTRHTPRRPTASSVQRFNTLESSRGEENGIVLLIKSKGFKSSFKIYIYHSVFYILIVCILALKILPFLGLKLQKI